MKVIVSCSPTWASNLPFPIIKLSYFPSNRENLPHFMRLNLLHSRTFNSGTSVSWYNRPLSFCMLTFRPLQLLPCCIFAVLLKPTDGGSQTTLPLFLYFASEARMSACLRLSVLTPPSQLFFRVVVRKIPRVTLSALT